MVDVYSVHDAAKFSWIKRLLVQPNAKWKIIMLKMLNISEGILNKNPSKEIIELAKTEFHKQIIESWLRINKCRDYTEEIILNEYIIQNKNIKIKGKMISEQFFNNDSSKNLKIWDIIDNNGYLKMRESINTELSLNMEQLNYNSLKSAIPYKWKKKIRKQGVKLKYANKISQDQIKNINPNLFKEKRMKQITKATSKEFYQTLVQQKQERPTAEETWISEFPFLEAADWKNIYKTPFNITSEPYLQSFQYKVLNRILNCNENLHKWKIKPDNICIYCDKIDIIEHHLYECKESKYFWERLQIWLQNNLEVSFPFTVCEIIFGIQIIKMQRLT